MTRKVIFVAFALLAIAAVAMAADVTGKWTMEMPAMGGPGGPGGGPGAGGPPGGGAPPDGAPPAGAQGAGAQGAGRGGPRVQTFDLKVDGKKLTGTVLMPGRPDSEPTPVKISNGKVDGDKITFEVSREGRNGEPMTFKYEFTLKDDQLVGKMTMPSFGGGDPRVSDVTAKRAAAK